MNTHVKLSCRFRCYSNNTNTRDRCSFCSVLTHISIDMLHCSIVACGHVAADGNDLLNCIVCTGCCIVILSLRRLNGSSIDFVFWFSSRSVLWYTRSTGKFGNAQQHQRRDANLYKWLLTFIFLMSR